MKTYFALELFRKKICAIAERDPSVHSEKSSEEGIKYVGVGEKEFAGFRFKFVLHGTWFGSRRPALKEEPASDEVRKLLGDDRIHTVLTPVTPKNK